MLLVQWCYKHVLNCLFETGTGPQRNIALWVLRERKETQPTGPFTNDHWAVGGLHWWGAEGCCFYRREQRCREEHQAEEGHEERRARDEHGVPGRAERRGHGHLGLREKVRGEPGRSVGG